MDFHELRAFLALAENLHFARAAAQVHMSPSALSRLLGRLEDELGVFLFERDTRRVSLTDEGEVFLSFSKETLHLQEDLRLRIGAHDDKLRGILRIYASVTACYSILPPLIEALSREHPALRLSVETGDPSDAAEAVREGRVELALDALPSGGFKDLDCHLVQKTPLVFISSSTGAYGKLDLTKERFSLNTFVNETSMQAQSTTDKLEKVLSSIPLILPKTGLSRERLDRWMRSRSIKPIIAAETAGNEAILALGRLGLGLGLVPRLVLENGPFAEGLILYNAGPDFGDYDIGFIQKPSNTGTEAARHFRIAIANIIQRTYPIYDNI